MGQILAAKLASQFFARVILALAVFGFGARFVSAVQCDVVQHGPPTEADKAYIAADYAKAERLYRADLAKHTNESIAGLVRALLRESKVQEAADTVNASMAATPNSAVLLSLRGEIEYRQGLPWAAAESADQSTHLDPCNPRNMLLVEKLTRLNSLYGTARAMVTTAHKIDPQDAEISQRWMQTLPLEQRIAEIESYLSQPRGESDEDEHRQREYLEYLKNELAEKDNSCHLASATTATEVPFIGLMNDANTLRAYGLDVKVNNKNAQLVIDTGASGLLISRSIAEHAGLKAVSKEEFGGIGDQGSKLGYSAHVDSIRIGSLEFQNCTARVLNSRDVVGDDGLICMDVFSQFLVTLDYPMHKLVLGPLPARPGDTTVPVTSLNTTGAKGDGDAAIGAPTLASKGPSQGPKDRFIALEMRDYTPIYRIGHDLIISTSINGEKPTLFIMDTGSWATTISPAAAREVTKVRGGNDTEVRGISGKVNKMYTADAVTFHFAHMSQKVVDVDSFDTSNISRNLGLEISGFIGATTLRVLTIHIDYRDGLVKFEYDPNRGYRYGGANY
jgi:Aspartyl protease